jgi:hypothetical protein
MVTIKKGQLKIEASNNSFVQLQDTSDGMFFKFNDDTELRISVPVTPQIKALSNMIMRSKAANIVIDFNSKNLVSFEGSMETDKKTNINVPPTPHRQ